MSDQIVAPETRDLAELASLMEQWLGRQMPAAEAIRLTNLDYPRGAGMSHETILFDMHWNESGQARQRGCVVRIKPGHHTVFPDDLFDQQVRLMQALHADGQVRVAQPLWYEQDPSVLGKPFFVMEKKLGRVPVSMPPYARSGWVAEATPAQRRTMWEAGVRQLALIQRVPLAGTGFPWRAGPRGARTGAGVGQIRPLCRLGKG